MVEADHPHAGGEHTPIIHERRFHLGPSPRGWGARGTAPLPRRTFRTIPTRVGSTPFASQVDPNSADHPHAGGEHESRKIASGDASGPSPRGWGAPAHSGSARRQKRTIPTRVGSTARLRGSRCRSWDHPHAGGEHLCRSPRRTRRRGPSPRGWGAPGEGPPPRTISSDHPHAGGEHARPGQDPGRVFGPSPRGWGALWIDKDLGKHLGHFRGCQKGRFSGSTHSSATSQRPEISISRRCVSPWV
jgi:hypothetical protein